SYQGGEKPRFDNVAADELKLWKVDISLEEENDKLIAVNTRYQGRNRQALSLPKTYNVLLKRRRYIAPQPLKSRLRDCFTFPDGTEDEHIVINRECDSEKESTTIHLVGDEDLASVIWTTGFKVELAIVVDTWQLNPNTHIEDFDEFWYYDRFDASDSELFSSEFEISNIESSGSDTSNSEYELNIAMS
ncbi:7719_t:CDS:2, partial [Ambispora gerdemannii]